MSDDNLSPNTGITGWKLDLPKGFVSNKQFAATNQGFRAACDAIDYTPTSRQASKYRRKFGTVFTLGKAALAKAAREEAAE